MAATKSASGKREIDEVQAREVRRIFVWYAAGKSPRWIAERLNEEGVSSPGADWHRTKRRRDGEWLASAIHGDPKRGSGILNNELYIGRYIWNRRRSRKKLRSGDREFLLRPSDDWITTAHPELCIVSEDVWRKVKARQRERAAHIGARVRRGLSKHQAYATGAYPKYLLSGLLQCGLCGSNLIVSGPAQGYVCATRVNGGLHACSNRLRLPRVRLEHLLLRWIHSVLIDAEAEQCLLRAWRARSGGNSPGTEYMAPIRDGYIQELRDEVSNLIDAMAHGALRSSSALADRLVEAELKLAAEVGNAAVHGGAGEIRPPRSLGFYEQFVGTIAARFQENSRDTHMTLADLIGGAIRLMPKEGTRELDVDCALSTTTFRLAQMSSAFIATRRPGDLDN